MHAAHPLSKIVATRITLFVAVLVTAVMIAAPEIRAQSAEPAVPVDVPAAAITLSDEGAAPAIARVGVGAEVVWVNNSSQEIRIWGERSLFLPMVANGSSSQMAASFWPLAQPVVERWDSGPIKPGQQFAHVFSSPGEFPYYASGVDGTVGVVVVLSDRTASTAWIEAAVGGSVQGQNSTLVVPPDALAQDAAITISEPIGGAELQDDGMLAVAIEPSGLTFSQPAALTIEYGDTGSYDEDLVRVVAFNDATGEWEPHQITAQNKEQNTITVQVSHFSWWMAYVDEPLYVVMEIPGKFLKAGHVLVRMDGHYPNCDGRGDWFPGHTGIFGGADGSGKLQIIESNVGGDFRLGCLSKGEVKERPFDEFVKESCGFYMGAQLNLEASADAPASAAAYAKTQIGKGYLFVGQGNWQSNCFSCVGLVEKAYDQAGASIIPLWEENVAITPLQQYRKLRPVNEITANVGEQVRIPVKTIYQVDVSLGGDHYEVKSNPPSASSLPQGASYSNGLFDWTPTAADAGKTYNIVFKAAEQIQGKQREVSQLLTIRIPAASQSPTASLNRVQWYDSCRGAIWMELSGFTPNSPISVMSQFYNMNCETGEWYSGNWVQTYHQYTDANGHLIIGYQIARGDHNYTFTDKLGKSYKLSFTIQP